MKQKCRVHITSRKIENIIIPFFLFVCSFYDFNKGIDIKDAGYSMGQFLHYGYFPGNQMIPTFWSNVLGNFFSELPGGNTWYGMSFYCTLVIAGTVEVSYFMCKKVLDWKSVAIAEVFAVFFCWNSSIVLYDYLSFFLFALGIFLLLTALEKENKNFYYIFAGVVFGINTFVRLPNIAEIAAIVLLWYHGYAKKWGMKRLIQRTILCMLGYILALIGSLTAILQQYGFQELKLAIYNLFHMSQSQDNYGVVYMATETFFVVVGYTGYLLGLLVIAFILSILLKKLHTQKKKLIMVFWVLTGVYYYFMAKYFKMYNWNWNTMDSVLGLACVFLLCGLICAAISLIWSKRHNVKLYALVYIGIFFVMPLGSNNNIYLEIMNMFLLIPITIYIVRELLDEWKERGRSDWVEARITSIKVICYGSLFVMVIHATGFGMNYVFNDVIEVRADKYSYAGMYSSEKRIEMLDEMYEFCESEELLGKEAIMYCNAPGISVVLDMPTALDSTWPDWYTYSIERFVDGMEQLGREIDEGKEYPLVIFSTPYHKYYQGEKVDWNLYPESMVDDKVWLLNKFMRENQYECVYTNDEFAIYRAIF